MTDTLSSPASVEHAKPADFDLARARRETPGVDNQVHLNNAGAALMPQVVLDRQLDYLKREALIGGYEAADEAREEIEGTYRSLARLINAQPEEIALVENATVAWQQAFYSWDWQEGDRILTAEAEYGANFISYLQMAKKKGIKVEVVPSDAQGQLDVEALEKMIDERVKLISVTHIPTNGGLVNPAQAIGKIARQHGIPYLLDACQSVGQLDIDVQAIGCDLLSVTGRKYLRGPRGSGFLYVKKDLLNHLEPAFLDHHGAEWTSLDSYTLRPDARRFENWEFNYAAVLGLGAAADYALDWGLQNLETRVKTLAQSFRDRLSDLPGVTVRDLGAEKCGICTFTVEGHDPVDLKARLRPLGFNTSTSSHRSSLVDMSRRNLTMLLRASVHYYNSEEELDRFCEALAGLTR
ncbi:aminotransferase class V-fold PLP-dependent enzyme [Rhodovibrionaceae bacterium A322]